ncbi:MFS transporter [Pectobacterium brasiliense]|uniref:MFS transporter n=1 Tax=Pectobacterium brasiliense TaxID=180957 RepID=UPI0015DE803D|nr:MFS transporter [Pectobacterium brasiliense]MBA0207905.1 MFS transporter [Pectobacterium brasiliense]
MLTGWTLNLVLVFHSRQFWQRIAAVYLAFALSGNNLPVICILMLFLGTANHLCVNLLITGLNTTDTSKRGAIMGLNSAVTYLAVFIGNTLFGALYLHWGYTTVLYAAVGFVVISILFTVQIRITSKR